MATKISQAEAKRLRSRVKWLEAERSMLLSRAGWSYPGTHMAQVTIEGEVRGAIHATQKLGFVMFVKIEGGRLNIYAVKP